MMESAPSSTNTRQRNKRVQKFPSDSSSDFPPLGRRSQVLMHPNHPLSSRLSNLIYLLMALTTLLGAFFTYRFLQYKTDVGGWWNLALGRSSPVWTNGGSSMRGRENQRDAREESVEDRINALASALGIPSNELASAIAGAVRSYVPPASLSSFAAKETGEAVKVLFSDPSEGQGHVSGSAVETIEEVVEGIVHGMESFVGTDDLELDT